MSAGTSQQVPGAVPQMIGAGEPAPAPAVPEVDPRDPLLRLETFFDPGSVELITPRDDSGMLAARGTVAGRSAVAFVSDATVQGGAMGEAGCDVILTAYERALADGCTGGRVVALRRRPAARRAWSPCTPSGRSSPS